MIHIWTLLSMEMVRPRLLGRMGLDRKISAGSEALNQEEIGIVETDEEKFARMDVDLRTHRRIHPVYDMLIHPSP
jgi:hypothetical protein